MIKKRNIDVVTRTRDFGEWIKVPFTAGSTNAISIAWQNPYTFDIIIERVLVDITTAGGTGSSVIDIDVVASATSTGDDIFDGIDANAAGLSDSLNSTDNGTNGEGKFWKMDGAGGTNDYITAKILVANAASLVGNMYIKLLKV